MQNIDLSRTHGWVEVNETGYDKGIKVMTISDTLNYNLKKGSKSMFMKMPPNSKIMCIAEHMRWEEIVIIKGYLKTFDNQIIMPGGYVNRPPYVKHGPFYCHPKLGCLMFVKFHFNSVPTKTKQSKISKL